MIAVRGVKVFEECETVTKGKPTKVLKGENNKTENTYYLSASKQIRWQILMATAYVWYELHHHTIVTNQDLQAIFDKQI
jgi:hypothetical protein